MAKLYQNKMPAVVIASCYCDIAEQHQNISAWQLLLKTTVTQESHSRTKTTMVVTSYYLKQL